MKRADLVLGVMAFAVAAAFVPGFVDAAMGPKWAMLAIGVPIALVLLEHEDLPLWSFAWLAAAAVPTWWAVDRLHALDELAHLVILAGAFYLGACARDLRAIWLGLSAGVALSSVIAVAQLLGFDYLAQVAPPAGLFVNRNYFGEAAMVALITGPLALSGFALAAIVMTTSKAATGALLVSYADWLRGGRGYRRLAWIIYGALALTAIVLYALGSEHVTIRLGIWQTAWKYTELWGRGLGAFVVDFPAAAPGVHNEPLQLAYELGVFALPALAVFIYAMGAPDAFPAARGVLVAIGALSLVSQPLHMPLTAFAAALCAGRLCAHRYRLRRRDDAWAMAPRFVP